MQAVPGDLLDGEFGGAAYLSMQTSASCTPLLQKQTCPRPGAGTAAATGGTAGRADLRGAGIRRRERWCQWQVVLSPGTVRSSTVPGQPQ